jgi:tubulin-specific chaperone A
VDYYTKEAKENEHQLARMKAEHRDIHDVKKFEEVLGESYMMIPDSQGRLLEALVELKQFLKEHSVVVTVVNDGDRTNGHDHDEPTIQSPQQQTLDPNGEWYVTAQHILDEHSSADHHTIKSKFTTRISIQQQQHPLHHPHILEKTTAIETAVHETNVDDIQDGEHF